MTVGHPNGWEAEELALKDLPPRWFFPWLGELEDWAPLGLVIRKMTPGLSSTMPGSQTSCGVAQGCSPATWKPHGLAWPGLGRQSQRFHYSTTCPGSGKETEPHLSMEEKSKKNCSRVLNSPYSSTG